MKNGNRRYLKQFHFKPFFLLESLSITFFVIRLPPLSIQAKNLAFFSFTFIFRTPPALLPILNYSKDWLNQIDIKELKKQLPRKQSCVFFPKRAKTAASTPDDLLLATLFNQTTGLIPFIKTWSNAKSNATCVILIDSITRIKMKDLNFTENDAMANRVHLVDVGDFFPPQIRGPGLYMIPNLEFVKYFGHFFNRIIIVDCNDVAFQGDPFQKDNKWDGIGFFSEHYTIEEQEVNTKWVGKIGSWYPQWCLQSEQMNTGMIAGTSKKIQALADLMLSVWNAPLFNDEPHDQGLILYLVMESFLRDGGMEYHTRIRNMLGIFRLPEATHEYFPLYTNRYTDEDCVIVHYYTRETASIIGIRRFCSSSDKVPLKCGYGVVRDNISLNCLSR